MSASPPRRPFEDSYLNAYSFEHVYYEFDMLMWLGHILGTSAPLVAGSKDDAQRLSNALTEGFGIHLRNVIDFLFVETPRPTDVVAADFCASGVWRAAIPPALKAARSRADKEIAHLTTSRVPGAPPEKRWDAVAVLAELRPVMDDFLSKARRAALADRAARAIKGWERSQ